MLTSLRILALIVLASAEENCAAGADGDTCSDRAGGESFTGIPGLLPPCKESFQLPTLAAESASWCNPSTVQENRRAPEKLQGLFWLKGLPLDDVAACFSNGEWDESTLTLKLTVWKDFMFMDSNMALGLVSAVYMNEMVYHVKFENSSLVAADINPSGNALGEIPLSAFAAVATFPLNELPASVPGDKWARPSYFGLGSASILTNYYEAWRILDGNLKVNEENIDVMMRLLGPRLKGMKINRFHHAMGDQCSSVDPGTEANTELHSLVFDHITAAKADTVPCNGGVLLVTSGQPALGVRHFEVSNEGVMFARAVRQGCIVNYLFLCVHDVVAVQATQTGTACGPGVPVGMGALRPIGWETCASESGVEELHLTRSVFHQTWDFLMEANNLVEGCVGLHSSKAWPELQGSMADQKGALLARKAAVGGCPFFQNSNDRMARGQDFGSLFGIWVRGMQHEQGVRADMWARGVGRWGQEPTFLERMRDQASALASLGFLAGASKENRTVAFCAFAEANCGEPAPFADGPQVFRHRDVLGAVADPTQLRAYSTATVEQTETCFDPSLPLFASSGSPEHTQVRKLLDAAGFDRLHKQELPEIEDVLPKSIWEVLKSRMLGDSSTFHDKDVGKFVVPLVLQTVFEKKPSEDLVTLALGYLQDGKICIFGKKAEDLMLLNPINKPKILRIRKAVAAFAVDSPRAEKFKTLIEKPEYAALKAHYAARGRPPADVLAANVADVALFAGVLGTTDMATKCVQYTRRDRSHLRLFRKDPVSYLHELMRYDGAVTSFTTALKEQQTWKMEGRDVELPPGTPVQMALASANRDGAVFRRASEFDPDRADANESLAWNGRLEDVITRNYEGAPRFCPGYGVSVKIAEAVCHHLTKDLHSWGMKPSGVTDAEDLPLIGTVKILKEGRSQNRIAQISHVTSAGYYCVVDKARSHSHLGCYAHSELEQLAYDGTFSRSLTDEFNRCPPFAQSAVTMAASLVTTTYMSEGGVRWMIEKAIKKRAGTEHMTPDWAGPYIAPLYAAVLHGSLRTYKHRHADSVPIPMHTGRVEQFTIGRLTIPDYDIDNEGPNDDFGFFEDFEVLPTYNCFQAMVRNAPFDDLLNHTDMNQWDLVMKGKTFARKKDWVMSWFKPYRTADGGEVWPEVEVDFASMFLKADMWDDELEKVMAFDLIGAHRVRATNKEFGGETLRYVIQLNEFKDIPVRDNFGKFGNDLYFTEHGIPAMIHTTDGRAIGRGDKDWQYWKFAWRSSFLTIITLLDHLHMTHFRAASTLAKAARATLSPDNPLRRFLSVFTFGTVDVNLGAAHTLVGPEHTLHRASPFRDFEDLSAAAPTLLEEPFSLHAPLYSDDAFDKLPELVKASPYFEDGKLLYGAIDRLVHKYFAVYEHSICKDDILSKKTESYLFTAALLASYHSANYESTLDLGITCTALKSRLSSMIWTVTGWHRHVGTVGDYYSDPELAAMSWKEGEAYSRPRQHMILAIIAAFTAKLQPKLIEDYAHVFKGIESEDSVVNIWKEFKQELEEISKLIDKRNSERKIKNYHHDPNIVECSVAV